MSAYINISDACIDLHNHLVATAVATPDEAERLCYGDATDTENQLTECILHLLILCTEQGLNPTAHMVQHIEAAKRRAKYQPD